MQIKDRVAVITGGASGLGLGCVRNIVANGGKVAIFDINETAANAIVEELGADKVMAVATNIAEEDSVKAGIEAVMAKFGRIDIAINSAGIGSAVKIYNQKTDEVHPLDVFQRVINVDLIGTFNVMRYAVQQMYKNEPTEDGERGVVINTSSTAAVEGGIGQAAYSAAKGGVLGLTVPCARELGRIGIRVMAILPGLFLTPMYDRVNEKVLENLKQQPVFPKRFGHTSEFASFCQQIIENPMFTAANVRLDGGARLQ